MLGVFGHFHCLAGSRTGGGEKAEAVVGEANGARVGRVGQWT